MTAPFLCGLLIGAIVSAIFLGVWFLAGPDMFRSWENEKRDEIPEWADPKKYYVSDK